MHQFLAHPIALDQFQRNVIILVPRQARPQALHLHWEGKAHLDTRIKTFEVRFVIIKRGFDHLKAERLFGMGIEAAHDAAHIDALFARL